MMRVRARVRADLAASFPRREDEIRDLFADGTGTDYRWHLDVPRAEVAEFVLWAVENLHYTSHVKEEIAMALPPVSRMDAMYEIWNAMYRVQMADSIPPRDDDDWSPRPGPLLLTPFGTGTGVQQQRRNRRRRGGKR
jgi:hypothetical protein